MGAVFSDGINQMIHSIRVPTRTDKGFCELEACIKIIWVGVDLCRKLSRWIRFIGRRAEIEL